MPPRPQSLARLWGLHSEPGPKSFPQATVGEKKAKCQLPFFYFPSLCALNSLAHLLYILSNAQSDSICADCSRFDSVSQRLAHSVLGGPSHCYAFRRSRNLSNQSFVSNIMRFLACRIVRRICWRWNFSRTSLGARRRPHGCSDCSYVLRLRDPSSCFDPSWIIRPRPRSRNSYNQQNLLHLHGLDLLFGLFARHLVDLRFLAKVDGCSVLIGNIDSRGNHTKEAFLPATHCPIGVAHDYFLQLKRAFLAANPWKNSGNAFHSRIFNGN